MKKLILLLIFLSGIQHHLFAQQLLQGGEWVQVAGKKIYRVDHPFGPLQPIERASRTSEKLEQFIDDNTYCIDSLKAIHFETFDQIVCADLVLASISDEDTSGSMLNRSELAAQRIRQIQKTANEIRKERAPEKLLQEAFSALLVILLLGLLLWANNKIFSFIRKRIAAKRNIQGKGIQFRGNKILRPQVLHGLLQQFIRGIQYVFTFLLIYFSLPVLFGLFPATKSWGAILIRLILYPFQRIITGITEYLPNLVTIVVLIFVFRIFLKILKFFAKEIHEERLHFKGFHADWAYPTYNIIRIPVLAFLLIILFPYLPGSSSPAFQGVTVFLGLLLSLGSTSAIGNIIAGVVITYMRPFKKGDRISAGNTIGYVLEKSLLVTRLRSIKNEIITIPNATLLNNNIVNYTRMAEEGRLILYTSISIGYSTSWEKVHALLLQAAERCKDLLHEPKPFVLQRALNDFYVQYEINIYCNDTKDLESLYSKLHAHIQDCFSEAGVEIMSPHYTSLRDGNSTALPDTSPGYQSNEGFRINVRP